MFRAVAVLTMLLAIGCGSSSQPTLPAQPLQWNAREKPNRRVVNGGSGWSLFSVGGGQPPYRYDRLAGDFPPGLAYSEGPTGVTFSGDATQAGQFRFTLRVIDQAGVAADRTFTWWIVDAPVVFDIPNELLPDGTMGSSYSFTFPAPRNGISPYWNWRTDLNDPDPSKWLPEGLEIDADTGVIRGVPIHRGTFRFAVYVSDSWGDQHVGSSAIPPGGTGELSLTIH